MWGLNVVKLLQNSKFRQVVFVSLLILLVCSSVENLSSIQSGFVGCSFFYVHFVHHPLSNPHNLAESRDCWYNNSTWPHQCWNCSVAGAAPGCNVGMKNWPSWYAQQQEEYVGSENFNAVFSQKFPLPQNRLGMSFPSKPALRLLRKLSWIPVLNVLHQTDSTIQSDTLDQESHQHNHCNHRSTFYPGQKCDSHDPMTCRSNDLQMGNKY